MAEDAGFDEANATMALPSSLGWSLIRGAQDPVLGWYSPASNRAWVADTPELPATDGHPK